MDSDDPISGDDYLRIAVKLWGKKILNERGEWYASSSDELEQIYVERMKELAAQVRARDKEVARLKAQLARSSSKGKKKQ